ncbi:hypothetical protein ACFXKD_20610 [Nocardiopsis aegyptia]|uniref:hypothetical protein n=1 Tax=Nocardiopsis aegyptia TaxID=220378 RepID=UPI003671D497
MSPDFGALAVQVLSSLGLGGLVLWSAWRGGSLGGVLALLLTWGPFFLIWTVGQQAAVAGSALFFWTVGPLAALVPIIRTFPSGAVRYHGRYVVPEDVSRDDSELLARLQSAIDSVRAAADLLGDGIGPARDQAWLREQEWSIATSLAQCTELQRDFDERERAAESDRVLASLEPQRRALDSARSAVAERVDRFEAYAERASSAAATYRELLQCEDNERRNDAYLGLITRSVAGSVDGGELGENSVRPLQESLDEQVVQTIDAGRWLIDSLADRAEPDRNEASGP